MSWLRRRNYCPPCPNGGSSTPFPPPNQARVNIGAVRIITDCTACTGGLSACLITNLGCQVIQSIQLYGSFREVLDLIGVTYILEAGFDLVQFQHLLLLNCSVPTSVRGPLCFTNTGSGSLTIEEITIEILDGANNILGTTVLTLSEIVPPFGGLYSTPFVVETTNPLICGSVQPPLRIRALVKTNNGNFTGGHPISCQSPSSACSFCVTDGTTDYTIFPGQIETTLPLISTSSDNIEGRVQTTFTLSRECGGPALEPPVGTEILIDSDRASLSILAIGGTTRINVQLQDTLPYDKYFSYSLSDDTGEYETGTLIILSGQTTSSDVITTPTSQLVEAVITPQLAIIDLSL